jgi:hypothetical protein
MAKIEVSKYAFRVPSPILVILYKWNLTVQKSNIRWLSKHAKNMS